MFYPENPVILSRDPHFVNLLAISHLLIVFFAAVCTTYGLSLVPSPDAI